MTLTTINVADLNGTNGFTILGSVPKDSVNNSVSVSNAGDINNDGIDDIVISLPGVGSRSTSQPPFIIPPPFGIRNNFDNLLGAGESYVIFGETNFDSTLNVSDLNGGNGFVIRGAEPGSASGTSVSNAGDINGDGIDDLIIGAPNADSNEELSAGKSYVVFGKSNIGNSGVVELSQLNGTNGFVVEGIEGGEFVRIGLASVDVVGGDRVGTSVSNAGDINGDGFDDLIIGAYENFYSSNEKNIGKSYVLFGGNNIGNSGTVKLEQLNQSQGFVITGENEFDRFGNSVNSAGDVNGDGFDDLIIGARGANVNGQNYVGTSYVLFGDDNIGASGNFPVEDIDGTNGFVIPGIESGGAGGSVSNAGDINGDGFEDLIIAASGAGNSRGKTYIIFGETNVGNTGTFDLSELNGTNGFVLSGANPNDFTGYSVSNAGDVNGDGFDDLIIGAPGVNLRGIENVGKSYVLLGGTNVGGSGSIQIDQINGFGLNGKTSSTDGLGDFTGRSVSNAGDINGDGFDDLVVGALKNSSYSGYNLGNREVESYVVFGFAESPVNTIQGTSGNDVLNGTANNDLIEALAGNDSVKGKSGNDVVFGGNGQDNLFGNLGDDSLEGGSGTDNLFGGADNDLLKGDSAFDALSGNNGNDLLVGGSGNDLLRGDAGNDTLDGGTGADTLFGGTGADFFTLRAGDGLDRIQDYRDGEDKFFLTGGLEFTQIEIVQNINNTQIQLNDSNEILANLNSVTANSLDVGDFIVV